MALLSTIISTIAIIIALSIAVITTRSIGQDHDSKPDFVSLEKDESKNIALHSKKVSRFLAQNVKQRNPNAADHCHKDHEICNLYEGTNSTCCNNKCVDLAYDSKNCGACKNKCMFTQTCCRGECVDLAYDKRHCGSCNHRCDSGEYCVYGMCNYA